MICEKCGAKATTMYIDLQSEDSKDWKEFPVCGDCLKALNRANNKEAYAEQARRDRRKRTAC